MTFATTEVLIKAMLLYPRRITCIDDSSGLVFQADDGTKFCINYEDFKATTTGDDVPFRVAKFAKATVTWEAIKEYCDSINYGKPDWDSKTIKEYHEEESE